MKKIVSKNTLKNKKVLITGGTGSFGKAFIRYALNNLSPESIRIYSRDELKQWEVRKQWQGKKFADKLRFFIGDVRDAKRLSRAAYGADVIIHAAALKHVPVCEEDPIEAVKTNVIGAINVIDAALDNNVPEVIALSTDKASQPINLYGATKLCSDKLFVNANRYRGAKKCRFAVVRYGNVMGSRGSVIPLFAEQKKKGTLTITDEHMTRFWISLPDAVKFVVSSLEMMQGGELFIPKIPSMTMSELARAIAPKAQIKIIGLRPGEKMHEMMISRDEASLTLDLGDRYVIKPAQLHKWSDNFDYGVKVKKVGNDFSYSSNHNTKLLSVSEMRRILKELGFSSE